MDRSITRNKNESIIKKKFQTSKSSGSEGFTGEFHQTFREESTPILLKLLQKSTEEGTVLNSFYENTITMIQKSDKDTTQKRKLQANITDEHAKILNKILAIQIQQYIKRIIQVGFIPGMQEFFNIHKSV